MTQILALIVRLAASTLGRELLALLVSKRFMLAAGTILAVFLANRLGLSQQALRIIAVVVVALILGDSIRAFREKID